MTLSDLMNLIMLAHEQGMDLEKTDILIRLADGSRYDFTPVVLQSKKPEELSSKVYLLPKSPELEPDAQLEDVLKKLKEKAKRNQEAKARKLS